MIRLIKIDNGVERDFFVNDQAQAESFLNFKPDKYKLPEDVKLEDSVSEVIPEEIAEQESVVSEDELPEMIDDVPAEEISEVISEEIEVSEEE